ncbi:amidohydrolase family protein [Nigerium massiliense]|uniref:amidohydrolase family protein n=1 Tax=Nigerium massiliense TaxID=1522317 RepID=UPI00058DF26F|nr:amidohydrolase family protein [Nigerium massiliense]
MQVTNARIRGRDGLWTIGIEGDTIASLTPAGDGAQASQGDFDAEGRLVCPQFLENHVHLDYANTAGVPRVNDSGTLFEAIEIWGERKAQGLQNRDQILANAREAARSLASHGVGYIRSHVDVTDPELTAFDALLELREEIKPWCHLELIAFPQNGVYAYPGGDKLMRTAMERGADVVGGIPHLEPTREDGVRSVQYLFDLAEEFGARLDIHCDEIDDEQSRFVEVMAAETTKRGMQGRVTVAHAVAMGYYNPGYMAKLLPKLKEAGLGFVINPKENLQLQGRGFGQPVPRGVAPIRDLDDLGLPVAFGQDSMVDPWYPLGDGDLVDVLDVALHVGHMLTPAYLDRALDFLTLHPATNFGLADRYGIEEGRLASLLVLDAADDTAVVRTHPDVLLSVHEGREVLRRVPAQTTWAL